MNKVHFQKKLRRRVRGFSSCKEEGDYQINKVEYARCQQTGKSVN